MTVPKVGLQSHIWNNNLKSFGLLAVYPFVIMGLVWAIALVLYEMSGLNSDYHRQILNEGGNVVVWGVLVSAGENGVVTPAQFASNFILSYWPVIVSIVIGWFAIAYFFQTSMIRRLSHSHPVTREEEPELYNLMENLCITVGIPMPRLEIIETHARNAFASGVDKKSFAVTVTRGLLQSLSKDEVEGVLAHELTHILNRDVRLLIITIIFTGMIGFAAQMVWSQVRYGLWVGRSSSRGNNKGNGIVILFIILAILWVGYIATIFTRFAISRRREYMADAGAVQITRNPDAMMRALMRIAGKDQIPKMPGDVAMMCIENRAPFLGLLATHPPIEKRIQALSDTTGFPVPDLPQLKPMHAPRASREEVLSPPLARPPRENWTTRQRFRHRRSDNPWY